MLRKCKHVGFKAPELNTTELNMKELNMKELNMKELNMKDGKKFPSFFIGQAYGWGRKRSGISQIISLGELSLKAVFPR
jgi:hypothetical protein